VLTQPPARSPIPAPINDGGDATAIARARSRAWWLVAGSLVIAFLARGPLYLSVFPPFEGWDEYQHLAYIAHLDETGTVPVFNESSVSPALRPLLTAMPHSRWGGEQVREWGALSYAEYWNSPPPAAGTDRGAPSSIRLYQAQHPPLAYVVALPVWRALRTHPLEAIFAIRTLNLLLVAAALVAFAGALTRIVPRFAPRTVVFALVCMHPLFFQNVARTSNDALAIATGLAGISLLALADGRTLLTRGMLAAGCIAVSIWSKQTGLTLIPALVLGLPLIGRAYGVSGGRLWRVTSVVVVVFFLLVAPLWLWNYQQYGSMVTTQESLELAARGSVLEALATSFGSLNWRALVTTLFVPGTVWVGGWSFLRMNATLANLHGWYWGILVTAAGIGAVIALRGRARPGWSVVSALRPNAGTVGLAVCAAVVIVTTLGMIHHALVSHALFGRTTTNPWYFMTALPFLFVLLVRGLEAIGVRLATVAAGGLAVLFVVIDLHGTWIQMPTHYANATDAALQWSRLTAIHPAILSGDRRWWFLAARLGALCLVIGGLMHAWRNRADPVTQRPSFVQGRGKV
jgi:hypothetical protein